MRVVLPLALLAFALVAVITSGLSWAQAGPEAKANRLFQQIRKQVFQIRVIDLASGDKYSIGSGFAVSPEGHVATNFHVVASFVHEPEKYRLELVRDNGEIHDLSLLGFDVVHDLAVVYSADETAPALSLSSDTLSKGERLYSVGNPHDLGMTIIEGTFNGLVENSRYQKFLFSGSLNAGMSGGPAFNAVGDVVGINVSKGGEQISFLVPVRHLQALLRKTRAQPTVGDFNRTIGAALLADQQVFYPALAAALKPTRTLGNLRVPDKPLDSLNCWGHTVDADDIQYEAVHQHCRAEDQIFVDEAMVVGDFAYTIEYLNTQALNPFQFYSALQERFDHPNFGNVNDEDHVHEFRCHTDTVGLDSGRWKLSTCLRPYADFQGLFDASMVMVSQDRRKEGAIVRLKMTGVSLGNALNLYAKLAKSVQWID